MDVTDYKEAIRLLRPRKVFTRQEINEKFHAKVAGREPIIIGAAGIGLVAKMEDIAGIDMVLTCSNDYFRMEGQNSAVGYMAYGDTNTIMLQTIRKILRMARNLPVIAGVGCGDPYRETNDVLDELQKLGVVGAINFPPAPAYGPSMDKGMAKTIIGPYADYNLIDLCVKRDMFAAGYAFNVDNAKSMAYLGADLIVAHAGITVGGMCGAPAETSKTLDETCEFTQMILDAAKKENPDVLVVCHGGPLNSPKAVQYCFNNTDVHGFLGCSATDRIPIESAIYNDVKGYSTLKLEKLMEK